jgi:hypothetical protein
MGGDNGLVDVNKENVFVLEMYVSFLRQGSYVSIIIGQCLNICIVSDWKIR